VDGVTEDVGGVVSTVAPFEDFTAEKVPAASYAFTEKKYFWPFARLRPLLVTLVAPPTSV